MAIRATSEDVRSLLGQEQAEVAIHLTTANLLVDSNIVPVAQNRNIKISDEHLKLLETWTAAHLYSMGWDGQLREETYGDAKNVYMGIGGMHFKATRYGQTACDLDPTDTLINIGNATAEMELLT